MGRMPWDDGRALGSSYSAVLLLGWPGLLGGRLGIRRWAGCAGLEADSDYAVDRSGRLGLRRRPGTG